MATTQNEIKKLAPSSEDPQIKAAISSCVAEEVGKGIDPTQAQKVCEAQVMGKTGKQAQTLAPTPSSLAGGSL